MYFINFISEQNFKLFMKLITLHYKRQNSFKKEFQFHGLFYVKSLYVMSVNTWISKFI